MDDEPARVHTIGRNSHCIREILIGRGESELLATTSCAAHYGPGHSEMAAESPVSGFDVPLRKALTDVGGTNAHALIIQQWDDVHTKAILGTKVLHSLGGSGRAGAKGEVLAYHDVLCSELSYQ